MVGGTCENHLRDVSKLEPLQQPSKEPMQQQQPFQKQEFKA